MSDRRAVASCVFAAVLALSWLGPAHAQQRLSVPTSAKAGQASPKAAHRVAIHVDDSDAKVMNLALNNARNILDYYKTKRETVAIEIVTYGPGLHMLRADTSPVKQRVAEMSMAPEITFAACGNTQANMAKQEGKDVALVSDARVVPSGVVRLMELQEQGYSYIRPSGR
jgi:intracellular sulfur oxidation DsrE/DsrF family protein